MGLSAHNRLGWFLVWAIVFCDIGTSVYYMPGILYQTNGDLAGAFVVLPLVAFVLLCIKYVETSRRFREGGGVVTVAETALGPWWGCLGGQLIMVDYFLTAAISATSGLYYIDSVVSLHGCVVPGALCRPEDRLRPSDPAVDDRVATARSLVAYKHVPAAVMVLGGRVVKTARVALEPMSEIAGTIVKLEDALAAIGLSLDQARQAVLLPHERRGAPADPHAGPS